MSFQHRFGLIGCGKIANKHSEVLNALEGASIESFCDLDIEKASALSKKFGNHSFASIEKMMEGPDLDTLVVLTPSGLHAENIKSLAKYKKNIIVEKPLALKLSDIQDIKDLVKQQGISLTVVKQNRFNKPIVLLKDLLAQNTLGDLFLGTIRVRWSRDQNYYNEGDWRGTWKNDGGVMTNQASHHVDMLQWLMGDVESIFARANTVVAQIEAEDTAIVSLKFKNGSFGVIEASTAIRPKDIEGSISILGTKGSVEIGGFSMNKMNYCHLTEPLPDEISVTNSENPDGDRFYAHREFYKDFLKRISEGKEPSVDTEEASKTMEIIHAIYKSVDENREVFLNEDNLQSKLGQNDQ